MRAALSAYYRSAAAVQQHVADAPVRRLFARIRGRMYRHPFELYEDAAPKRAVSQFGDCPATTVW
jgi:hypothetical protein